MHGFTMFSFASHFLACITHEEGWAWQKDKRRYSLLVGLSVSVELLPLSTKMCTKENSCDVFFEPLSNS